MVVHLLREYAAWWRLNLVVETVPMGPSPCFWRLEANTGHGMAISMPVRSEDRIPPECTTRMLLVGGTPLQLPCPVPSQTTPTDFSLPFDLFNFLAGQLWRAEEQLPQFYHQTLQGKSQGFLGDRYHFFDRPFVDLWIRGLFEQCLGGMLLEPSPHYWLTFDVDCLQKWKPTSRIRHYLQLPKALYKGHMPPWSLQFQEIQRSRRPQDDPWYQIPQILQRVGDRRCTFFWLGHARDHQAYRYDIRRMEFSALVEATLKQGHLAGLHGSPRHAKSPHRLAKETARLQKIIGAPLHHCRQHYLRIHPKITLHALDQLGYRIDSTLGFNDRPGFRCGSCIPIRWWDFHRNQALRLAELPFSVGDFNVHNPSQFHLERSRAIIRAQAGWTLLAGGILTLLFHELYFWEGDYPGHAHFFSSVLADLEGMGLRSTLP